jgi:hypothetical protein
MPGVTVSYSPFWPRIGSDLRLGSLSTMGGKKSWKRTAINSRYVSKIARSGTEFRWPPSRTVGRRRSGVSTVSTDTCRLRVAAGQPHIDKHAITTGLAAAVLLELWYAGRVRLGWHGNPRHGTWQRNYGQGHPHGCGSHHGRSPGGGGQSCGAPAPSLRGGIGVGTGRARCRDVGEACGDGIAVSAGAAAGVASVMWGSGHNQPVTVASVWVQPASVATIGPPQ